MRNSATSYQKKGPWGGGGVGLRMSKQIDDEFKSLDYTYLKKGHAEA